MGNVRRTALIATPVAVVAAITLGMLGVASGEGPAGSTATRTVSVEGVGIVPIGGSDSAAQADAAYREGMAKALADGQSKAAFLGEKAGVALGAVLSIVEDGGGIECSGLPEGERYAPYEGEQPDFGYARAPTVLGVAPAAPSSAAAKPVSHRPKTKAKHRPAHKASAARCNLTANVSAVYALG